MSDPIARLNAALEGRYRIERQLGEGGMATVYLADDIKHERKVALKVLKPELAAVVGAERFLAEIKTTANLQHPHILPLFDSGEADTYLFYVMPYVEGETLRDRLDREHQFPVDEAVKIAISVAEALDYAHRQGVIHRDIKPANILLQDGKPVISDFGIALAVGVAGGGRLTETGLSLGTPHYMSPEQATGDLSVGAATDVYALGCVLYEMLVGEPPYTGSTAQAILGKIVTGEPDPVMKHRKSVPANVGGAIRKALEKVPADRFKRAEDFAKALADPAFRHGATAVAGVGAGVGAWNWLTGGLAGLAVVLSLALGWSLLRPEPALPVERFTVLSRSDGTRGSLTVSPDGTAMVVELADSTGQWRLWLRRWSDLLPLPIPGGEGGWSPAISPDGGEMAFLSRGPDGIQLSTLPLVGGAARTLANDARCCVRWGADGFVYYGAQGGDIHRVAASGGQPEVVAVQEAGAGNTGTLGDFQYVPGSDWGVYHMWDPQRIMAQHRITGEQKELTEGLRPYVTRSGHLVFALDGQVLATRLDIDAMELSGPTVALVEDVYMGGRARYPLYWVSESGHLTYWSAGGLGPGATTLVWVDREGREEALGVEIQQYWYPRLSPTGDRVAVAAAGTDGNDLWVFDIARGSRAQITFGGDNRYFPVWAPDGDRLAFASAPLNSNVILAAAADGSGRTDTLLAVDGLQFPTSWSRDGRRIAYYESGATTQRDLWVWSLEGQPEPFLVAPFQQRAPEFSPDGRWLAYVSNKSGQNEVYMRPYPGPGSEVVVSTAGGVEPAWSPDGSELFYRGDSEMMVVDLREAGRPGSPRPLWTDRYQWANANTATRNYDVAPGGERLLMVAVASTQSSMIVVLNWEEELKRLVPN